MGFFKNKCESCALKKDFDRQCELNYQEYMRYADHEIDKKNETLAFLTLENDAIKKRLEAAAQQVEALRWIRDRFEKFDESPDATMDYCENVDPEYRKQIQEVYVCALTTVINALNPPPLSAGQIGGSTRNG